MKISQCVVWVQETPDSYLAACTLTKAIIRLNVQAKKDLENGDPDTLSELTKEEFEDCVEMGFLIPDELDEKNYLSYLLHKDRFSPQSLTTFVSFSTACNFECIYCYQAGQVKHQTIDETTIERLVEWYRHKLEQGHFEICSVDLYGGEPLLFVPYIITLLSKLKEITSELDVKLDVRLVTNGFLLTPEITRQLMVFGLNEVHVTIDGPKKAHNQRRPLKGGGETFDVILENLLNVALLDLPIDVICRVSFDNSNVKDIPALLDLIKEKDKTGNIHIYFGSITQTTSQIVNPESFCSQHVLEDEEAANNIIFLYTEAKKRGFPIPEFFTLGPCMVVAESGGIISPDGSIYKCIDMIGCSNLEVGNIVSEEYSSPYYDFMAAPQLEYCLNTDCPFIPVCGGGCVMESYLKLGNYKESICHRKMLEKIYNGLLSLQFSS